jgi:hypothetical protein
MNFILEFFETSKCSFSKNTKIGLHGTRDLMRLFVYNIQYLRLHVIFWQNTRSRPCHYVPVSQIKFSFLCTQSIQRRILIRLQFIFFFRKTPRSAMLGHHVPARLIFLWQLLPRCNWEASLRVFSFNELLSPHVHCIVKKNGSSCLMGVRLYSLVNYGGIYFRRDIT